MTTKTLALLLLPLVPLSAIGIVELVGSPRAPAECAAPVLEPVARPDVQPHFAQPPAPVRPARPHPAPLA